MDSTIGHKWEYHVVVRFPEDEETSSMAVTPLDSSYTVEQLSERIRRVKKVEDGVSIFLGYHSSERNLTIPVSANSSLSEVRKAMIRVICLNQKYLPKHFQNVDIFSNVGRSMGCHWGSWFCYHHGSQGQVGRWTWRGGGMRRSQLKKLSMCYLLKTQWARFTICQMSNHG